MERITGLAARLIESRKSGRRLPIPTGADAPSTFAEAYAVQAAVMAGLGEMIGGYKVGISQQGVATFAPIHRSGVIRGGSVYSVRPFDRLGVELELAFRFARQVPATASGAGVLDAVDAVFVAMELCETRYTTTDGLDPLAALADHQSNRGVALGTELRFDRTADLKGVSSRWLIDGKVSHERKASHPAGDPLAPLAVLPRLLAEQGRALEPGHVVITGSLNGMTWVPVGTKVLGVIDGLGDVEITISA